MTGNKRSANIDWGNLADALDALHACGSDDALRAIENIIGVEAIRASVDHYISGRSGSELARQVLWQIHPWSAMQRCKEIYDRSDDIHARRSAVELLRVVADNRAVAWIEDFLNDPDEDIQNWGAGIVDQLLFSHLVEPEILSELLTKMAVHSNENVRRMHALSKSFLKADAG